MEERESGAEEEKEEDKRTVEINLNKDWKRNETRKNEIKRNWMREENGKKTKKEFLRRLNEVNFRIKIAK